jgi:hypothetical protein
VPAFKSGAVPNPNANTTNAVKVSFFAMFISLCVVWPIEPSADGEVAEENSAIILLRL